MVNTKFAPSSPPESPSSPPASSLAASPTTNPSTQVEETPPLQLPTKRQRWVAVKTATPASSISPLPSSTDYAAASIDDEATEEDSSVHISLSDTDQPPIPVPFSPTTTGRRQPHQFDPTIRLCALRSTSHSYRERESPGLFHVRHCHICRRCHLSLFQALHKNISTTTV